jgi:DNA-binding phage protein
MYSVFCVLDSQAPEHGLDAKALTESSLEQKKKLAKVKSIAEVLQVIELVRERENIPKAELARRMERKPEAISRLLRGEGANPTLETLIDLADAIGLELDIRIKRQPAKRNGHYSPLKVHSTV